jgi:putative flippase GtrA
MTRMYNIKLKKWIPETFWKAQVSSLLSTLADFLFTLFFAEALGIWYLASSFMGMITGGCVNFLIGRNWVFKAEKNESFVQAKRYIVVWAGSLSLNTLGIYLFTDVFRVYYLVSKLLITVWVGVFFNFYLQRSFVFKT